MSLRYCALLRGINVGGKNTVAMERLRALFSGLGHRSVATHIQSGNVVFASDERDASKVATDIERAIARTLGLAIDVIVRTRGDLAETVAHNPFLARGADPSRLFVVFLAGRPSAESIDTLDPHRSPPDELVVRGHDVYLHCPNGFGQTKLTIDYFARRLGVTATARNWNTVAKLSAMMEA